MNNSLKTLMSILLGFIIVNYAFSLCDDYQIVSV